MRRPGKKRQNSTDTQAEIGAQLVERYMCSPG